MGIMATWAKIWFLLEKELNEARVDGASAS